METYLGEPLFPRCYGIPAAHHCGPGLVEYDRLLISKDCLQALSQRAQLGIATGRTRCEARIGLDMMDLSDYFGAVTTMTHALEKQAASGSQLSLLKPHPYLLHLAADALDSSQSSRRSVAAYVGDTPDDILAARRADGARRWLAIGLTPSSADPAIRQYYLDLGADLVLSHPDELTDALF
jgi:phosphoglycolate phosphatase-like HAD superfamily hydrolase